MIQKISPGKKFRQALKEEHPLQIAGVVNAYCAILAQRAGFRALYVSGAGVANASFGLPDLGMTTLSELVEEVRRITRVSPLPLLVDADTGFGGRLMIGRTVRELEQAGAAGLHIEDQQPAKRCGHRPNKRLVSAAAMCERIEAAAEAKSDPDFLVMARTDACAVEGLESVLERAMRYVEAGAEMIFAEALTSLDQYRRMVDAVKVPVLANVTEFGKTPLFSLAELREAGVSLALYPLSAFRAMSAAALKVYAAIKENGTQADLVGHMQTRDDLYACLDYLKYEALLDQEVDDGNLG